MIKLDINIGDTILLGKFRNKKVLVKSIDYNEHELPTVNGKNIVSFRYHKQAAPAAEVQVEQHMIKLKSLIPPNKH